MKCTYFAPAVVNYAKANSNTPTKILVIADSLCKVNKNILGKMENPYEVGLSEKNCIFSLINPNRNE